MFFLFKTYLRFGITLGLGLLLISGLYQTTFFAQAAPNYQINYQGKLTTPTNVAVADNSYVMAFSLYSTSTGGTAIWTEVHNGANEVEVTSGLFSVMLGSISSLAAVDFNQPLYLGITIDLDSEMTPRKILGTVPAAFEAKNANTVGGIASSSFLRSDQADTASGLLTFTGGLISNSSTTISNLTTTIATTTTLVINNQSFTNLTGAGLQNNSGVLSVSTTAFATTTEFNTSAKLAAILGDETGTGSVVFNASPTFTGTSIFSDLTTTNATTTNLAISSLTSGRVPYVTTSGRLIDSANLTFNGTSLTLGTDVALSRGAANRLDLATGDSLNLVSGNIQFGGTTYFENVTSNNLKIGATAGLAASGNTNLFLGLGAGSANSGSNNNFIGTFSGYVNTGQFNEMIGSQAGRYLQSTSTVAIGTNALYGSHSTNYISLNNVAVGYRAGYASNDGSGNNILLGYQAADSLTTGANNIIIGYDVEAPSNTGSNQLNIGNILFGTGIDGQGTTLSSGNIGIGSSSPSAKLTVAGTFLATGTSTLATTTATNLTLAQALGATSGGTGLSSITQNQLLIGGAGNTWTQIATSSLGLSASFTNSAGLAALLSDETGTGLSVFNASPTFTGLSTFADIFATNATTTNATTTNFAITSLTSGRVPYVTAGGRLINSTGLTYDGTSLGVNSIIFNPSFPTSTSVTLASNVVNRLDLATGDSLNFISGSLQVAATTVMDSSRRLFTANGALGAGTLAYSFSGDTDTGIYRSAADVIQFATGGIKTLEISRFGELVTAARHGLYANSSTSPYLYAAEIPFVGNANTLVGINALAQAWDTGDLAGGRNTAIGLSALAELLSTGGTHNVAVGQLTLSQAATSSASVVIGSEAMFNTQVSLNNSVVGYRAGYLSDIGGDNNILLGYRAADNLTTGNNNIIIGYDIDNVTATTDNALNIGNLIFGTGIDGTGTTLSSGNIGIGTSSPTSKLTVAGDLRVTGAFRDSTNNAGTAGMVLQTTGSGTQWVATSSLGITGGGSSFADSAQLAALISDETGTGNAVFSASPTFTGTANFANLNATGNVGIGTTTPDAQLTVENNSVANALVYVRNASTTSATALSRIMASNGYTQSDGISLYALGQNYTSNGAFKQDSGALDAADGLSNGLSIISRNTGAGSDIRFYTGGFADGNERMHISETGNVGLATSTNLTNLLTVNGTSLFTATSTFSDAVSLNGDVSVFLNSGEDFIIDSNYTGNVFSVDVNSISLVAQGITIDPITALSILSAVDITGQLELLGSASNIALGSNWLSGDGGDEGVFVDSAGNVGIGTTSPSSLLSVAGTSAFTGQMNLQGTAANIALGSNFLSGDGGDEGLFVNSSGQVTVNSSGSIGLFNVAGTYAPPSIFTRAVSITPVITSSHTDQMSIGNASTFQPTGAVNTLYTQLNLSTVSSSSQNISAFYGIFNRMDTAATYTGTITNGYGVFASNPNLLGTNPITNYYGVFSAAIGNGNGITSGTVTNYGLYAGTITAAAGTGGTVNNYGITAFTPSGNTAGTSNYGLTITGNGGASATNNYSFFNNSTAKSYFAGDVGIGTASPNAQLTIQGTDPVLNIQNINTAAGSGGVLRFGQNQASSELPVAELRGELTAGGGAGLRAGDLSFWTSNAGTLAERMRIFAGGNVSIGTTTALGLLTLNTGGSGGAIVATTPNGETGFIFGGAGVATNRADIRYNNSALSLVAGIGTGVATSGITILNNGYVGIGTTTPLGLFNIAGGGSDTDFRISRDNNANYFSINAPSNSPITTNFGINGTDVMSLSQTRVGIGTTTMTHKLTVNDSQSTDYVARIINSNTANTADGLLISLAVANASRTTGNYFIGFSTLNGTVAGKIQGGADAVAYTTTAADLAEYFNVSTNKVMPEAGEIVALDDTNEGGVMLAEAGQTPFGIVATNPGFIGNGPICNARDVYCDENYAEENAIISLIGQVPVKVNGSNGPIAVGDPITISSIAGEGMRANFGDRAVGYALTSFEPSNTASSSTITAYVSIHTVFDINLSDMEISVVSSSTMTTNLFFERLQTLIGGFVDGVLTLVGIKVEEVQTERLCIGDTCVTESELKNLLQSVNSNNSYTPPPPPNDNSGIGSGDSDNETDEDEGDISSNNDGTSDSGGDDTEPQDADELDDDPVVSDISPGDGSDSG